jgi:hypothetical protein
LENATILAAAVAPAVPVGYTTKSLQLAVVRLAEYWAGYKFGCTTAPATPPPSVPAPQVKPEKLATPVA